MKYFVLFAVLAIGLAQAAPTADVWELFKTVHQKTYETETEELLRKEIFQNNIKIIEEHNKKFEAGEVSFEQGVNQFSDLTKSEYKALVLGFKKSERKQSGASGIFVADAGVELPSEFDWRKKGAVTPIKNQEACGSCWAFGTVGALEGAHAIKTGKLVPLSEEQLVDCSEKNDGCGGGDQEVAFDYIINAGGLESESEYPYTSGDGSSGRCKFSKSKVKATMSSYVQVKSGDEDALKQAVATKSPMAIAIYAALDSFQHYKSGVYYAPSCPSSFDELDHVVTLIGYGTENGQDYWLVKNSWGTGWGDNGYIKMARNRDNNCGIATEAAYPVV